ncbi:MAG: UDP-glucose 4-epimerase GalE [Marinicaulis sp.]|nr:UDP-glucose 4-epimerase GalE [Marinicaulis sp.]NNE40932.1 UDP-glucose 4-epimerase GalE [Marinicaulis sp.]
MAKNLVVTGGAGYIGSHVAVDLINAGHDVLIIDNFVNSHPKAIERIKEIAPGRIDLLERDLANADHADEIVDAIKTFGADGAVHLAGLKAVGESVEKPAKYYSTNIGSALTLIRALEAANAKSLVFSSSATVYGDYNDNPVTEDGETGATNPYGRTKLFIEEILKDIARADNDWKIVNLRYFNPVGAHPSGKIGEDPNDIPNNLFPYIAQVAIGRREKLTVFGNDYATRDGTGVRDYIHVCDLARGHVKALDWLSGQKNGVVKDINLGAGVGYSVLEAVSAFKRASNRDIPYEIAARREGDIAEIYADAGLANELLNWKAEKSLEEMCADHWRWQSQNPNGYKTD